MDLPTLLGLGAFVALVGLAGWLVWVTRRG
jgi:hypothetical protein